ncbi:MAG: aldehyde ferredoxin oxidoreductase family protein [Candidatus Lokiarchaeota archaeon]|nr:aldehyde ferredoxin oxidoreductase family protein [Candidatus Lokiarchaeota archaeon]
MTHGYMGKQIWINLSKHKVKTNDIDGKILQQYLGGKGLGLKLIYDYVKSNHLNITTMDAFSPNNVLYFGTGPGTGIKGFPCPGRYHVMALKSPLTGSIGSANSGGSWGPFLKFAGFDGIFIEGKSEKPVYITILDGKVEIHDASDLWGFTVFDLEDELQKRHKSENYQVSITSIGPSGERLSLIGCIMNDKHRAAGRTGMGAVMGSKNLKAIVVGGTKRPTTAAGEDFKPVSQKMLKKMKDNPVTGEGLPKLGTAVLVNVVNSTGSLPLNNWQQAYNENVEPISGETLAEKYLIKALPCWGCTIACGRTVQVLDGPFAVKYSEGPEYESIWALGNSCGVMDLPAIIKANHYCNEFGLDTISVGSSIACAMELAEKGHIPEEDLQGLILKFGDPSAMVDLIWRAAYQTGIGKYIAMGSAKLAEHYGHPELSMSVKSLEMPAYDPRGIKGIGLNYATSNRGGCHVTGYTISPEVIGLPEQIDRLSYEGKEVWVKIFQDFTSGVNSTVNCLFATFALGAGDYAELLTAVTGWDINDGEFLKIGERIYNLERHIMDKLGIKNQDTLPKRLLEEPIPEGPSKGEINKLEKMLGKYYELRGWSDEGIPLPEKLKELGID